MSAAYTFKYITLGDSGVGKSCLTYQFTDEVFPDGGHTPTIGTGFGHRTLTLSRKKIKIHIWDTAGQERFRTITQMYYRDTAVAMLVYDITNKESFNNIGYWLNDIRLHGSEPMPVIMIIGNKSDLEDRRAVSKEEGFQFALDHDLLFLECSAKTADNVENAFIRTAVAVCQSIRKMESDGDDDLTNRGVRIDASKTISETIQATVDVTISNLTRGSSCCS